MKDTFLPRLGTFFTLIGLLFLIIFISSILGRDVNIKYLLFSSTLFLLAALIRRINKKTESTRFATLRKIRAAKKKVDQKGMEENLLDQENKPFPQK